MTWFKKSFYVLTMIAIATMVSGCSKKTQNVAPNKSFVIWSFEDEDVWKPIISDAEKNDLKGYEIKYVKKTLDSSYENDALNSILSGTGPDLWSIPNDWVYRHKDKLTSMPQELIDSSKINLDDNFVPIIKNTGEIDGKIYSISPTYDYLQMYYNPTLFSQALEEYRKNNNSLQDPLQSNDEVRKALSEYPKTWTALSKIIKHLNVRVDGSFQRSAVALGSCNNITNCVDILYGLMQQNETQMVSQDLKTATFNLDTKTGLKAFEFFLSFSNPSSDNFSWDTKMPNAVDAFADNKVAMIIGDSKMSNYIKQKYPSFSFAVAPLPQIELRENSVKSYSRYYTLVSPKQSENSKNAWSLIYKASSDFSQLFSSALNQPRTYKGGSSGLLGASSGSDTEAESWNKGRYPVEIDGIFKSAIQKVNNSITTTSVALDEAAAEITSKLRKEEW